MLAVVALLLAFTPIDLSDEAVAREEDRVLSLQLAFDGPLWPPGSPGAVGHGLARVRYVENALIPGRGGVELDLNTDTVTLGYHHPDLFGPWTYARVFVRGQAFAASLLVDHARGGVQDPERGFAAGYLQGGGLVAFTPVARPGAFATARFGVDGRQWFAFPFRGTSDELVLPAPSQAIEPNLALWTREGARVTALGRLSGLEAFADARAFLTSGRRAYGALRGVDDGRNAGEGALAGRAEGGVATGLVTPSLAGVRLATQGWLRGGAGAGLDDRTRFLVGGENAYVIPLAGASWGELLVDRYVMAELRGGIVIVDRVGLDAGVHVGMVNDVKRTGALDDNSGVSGAFAELELRPVDDVLVRARLAKSLVLPRPQGDTGKLLILVEWRALPWASWF